MVGIGASAGGVEALQAFFEPMPPDPGMAFVIVMHIGEGYESALPQILGRTSALPIVAVRDGEAIAANHVYVVTSNAVATVRRGRLRLRPEAGGGRERNPIDVFLASLAEAYEDWAVGVILSGSGHDGTLGSKAIKEKGGMTVAQRGDHGTPRYPDMPLNAIASGAVDLQIPVEEMAPRLIEYAQSLGTLENGAARNNRAERDRIDKARQEICQILRNQVGHDFSGYKERTFLRRIERRMQVLSLRELDAYLDRLRSDGGEVIALFHDLLIGVTAFFRDREAFQALADQVIPLQFQGKGASDTVRIWVPGCATGEEVYSLAILLIEHLDTLPARPKVVCFATDIDEPAIAVARAARYPAAMLQNVSAERLDRFFTGDGTSYSLTKEVRDLCIFSSHSVIRDPPFSRVDLISCRNLLIYLDRALQRQLIPVFHYALRPGGYLFLGISESLTEHAQLFSLIDKQYRFFQRREHQSAHLNLPLAVPESGWRLGSLEPRLPARGAAALPLRHLVDSRVIEQFAPAHVVVTRDGEAVHFSTRTGKYLELAPGVPNRNVLAMARRGLRLDLRTALAEAADGRRPVCRPNVRVEFEGRIQIVDLTVEPLPGHDSEPLYLVVFADVGPALEPNQLLPVITDEDAASNEHMERELRDVRERLQAMVEEYETALEELKSANEELVSINEELQSTNEELETSREETQSINEELNTVNSELQRKVEELDRANDNLRNLFEGTEIATVFLDQNLVIRSFTPAIKSLMDVDRGRPLTDIFSELSDIDLRAEVNAVLATGQPRERRVVRRDGKAHYLMRVLPYRTAEKTLDGVLVTFTDVTRIVEIEQHQVELTGHFDAMLRLVGEIVGRSMTPGAARDTLLNRVRALGRVYSQASATGWDEVDLAGLAARELGDYGIARDGRVAVEGSPVLLRLEAAVSLGMALHELAANAARFGAQSVPQGRVRLGWAIETEGTDAAQLAIRWQETGGPEVKAVPAGDRGYGAELIETRLKEQIGATGSIVFADGGVTAEILLPLASGLVVLPEANNGASSAT